MFQITAIFNKHCLEDVLTDLYENDIEGVTVMDVIGKGSLGFSEKGKIADLNPKVMILTVVSDASYKDRAMECIRSNTQDLGHGAGKMWVTAVIEAERIRTGEKDASALLSTSRENSKKSDNYFTATDTPSS